jgi:glycosyltransferase involved in cell wall biosynthesis
MPDLITAIIPTYNRARYLPRALQSVAAQDHRPLEAIVVDDGSKDNTADLIPAQKALLAARGVELTYLRQKNGGPARARNAGLDLAQGKYIACLDSDDMWKPAFLSTMLRLLDTYPTAGLAFGGYLCIDPDDRLTGERPTGLPPEPREALLRHPFPGIMDYMPTGTPCIMMRRVAIDEVGQFDFNLHIGEDWDLWYRIGKKFDFAYCLEGLTLCRDHPQNMEKGDSGALADKVKLILKHLPDIHDPAARDEQVRRLRCEMELLQEQLLRERTGANGIAHLLQHDLAPRSLRFKVGSVISRQPRWIGSAYAKVVRWLGGMQRQSGLHRRQEPVVPSPQIEVREAGSEGAAAQGERVTLKNAK